MFAKLALVASLAASTLAVPRPQADVPASTVATSASSMASSSRSTTSSSAAASPAVSSASSVSAPVSASASSSAAAPSATSYLDGLLAAISARNAPALAALLANETTIATAIGQTLSSGQPYTLLCPSDPGLEAALATIDTSNTTLVQMILEYHLLPGNYSADALGVNETSVINTALNENVVLYRDEFLTTQIVGGQNSTVLGNSTYQNVLLKLIDNALTLPTNVTSTWNRQPGASQLLTTLTSIAPSFTESLDSGMLTIFAPNNQAISNVQSELSSLASNVTALETVIRGHIINGTTTYVNAGPGALINNGTAQSAAGTTLQFLVNTTGAYVTGSGTTARITEGNVIVSNGVGQPAVIHIIDAVLAPPASSGAATASGSASASSASAARPTSSSASMMAASPVSMSAVSSASA